MRILLVSAYGLPHMGGIEVAVDALASEFSGRGHSVATSPPPREPAREPRARDPR